MYVVCERGCGERECVERERVSMCGESLGIACVVYVVYAKESVERVCGKSVCKEREWV